MANVRVNRFQTRTRRKTQWGQGPSAADVSISSNAAALWSVTSVVTSKATITRVRGLCEFMLNTADTIGAGFFGAVGLILVSDEAAAAGVNSVPSPLSQLDAGWLWHSFYSVRTVTATIGDGVNSSSVYLRISIDNKAMRIQAPNQTLVGVIDQTESTNAVMEFHANTRILDKLS